MHIAIHRYTWIRGAQRPCSKKTSRLKRKELAGAISQLLLGNLPSDERSQVQAELRTKKQNKEQKMVNTLKKMKETGPGKYVGHAPIGRPAGIPSKTKEQTQLTNEPVVVCANTNTRKSRKRRQDRRKRERDQINRRVRRMRKDPKYVSMSEDVMSRIASIPLRDDRDKAKLEWSVGQSVGQSLWSPHPLGPDT